MHRRSLLQLFSCLLFYPLKQDVKHLEFSGQKITNEEKLFAKSSWENIDTTQYKQQRIIAYLAPEDQIGDGDSNIYGEVEVVRVQINTRIVILIRRSDNTIVRAKRGAIYSSTT